MFRVRESLLKNWNESVSCSQSSLLATSHRSFSKIIRTIQQLHQHQINTRDRNQQTNRTNRIVQRYYANKFQQIIQSYGSLAFEEYLLHLIPYLPVWNQHQLLRLSCAFSKESIKNPAMMIELVVAVVLLGGPHLLRVDWFPSFPENVISSVSRCFRAQLAEVMSKADIKPSEKGLSHKQRVSRKLPEERGKSRYDRTSKSLDRSVGHGNLACFDRYVFQSNLTFSTIIICLRQQFLPSPDI